MIEANGVRKVFHRKEEIWIRKKNGDITVPEFDGDIVILGNQLYHKTDQELEVTCLLNGRQVYTANSPVVFENGDVLELACLMITFFDAHMEIQGNPDLYETSLPQKQGVDNRFEGFPYYKKSPRIIRKVKAEKIELSKPPTPNNLSPKSLAQVIVPPLIMLGITIASSIMLKRGAYVIVSVCMTVVTLLFSIQKFIAESKELKEENQKREKIYEDYLVNIRKKIRRLRNEEVEIMEYKVPSLQQLEYMVASYDSRLYERSYSDEDFLEVSLGIREGKSQIQVSYKDEELSMTHDPLAEEAKRLTEDFKRVSQIPVTINLKRAHLGIVGDARQIREQLKYLLAQLTFFQSYHDLEIIFITNESNQREFSYLRWYPHLKIKAINAIAGIYNEGIKDQVLGSVLQIVKDRKQKTEENQKVEGFLPHLLFIIDEPKLINNHAIMEYLQGETRHLGISIIYTTNQVAKLPENIKTVCTLENSEEGILLLNEGERINQRFSVVHVGETNLERMARQLAAIIHEKGITSKIPESITFFDLFHVSHPRELQVEKRWKEQQSHKSLAVPLGVREQDSYVELNLHEKAHGPHGLVAGTTGSGKSEIVQSYILSLAVNFHPYEVGFLLIDYKGGGMANLFEKLPHLLGTITNLDGAASYRAMVSIKSELARRQKIFNDFNVNHINGYNQLFKRGDATEPLPHLFLISDEFAELKKEQPEFMKELVSAARIGRSLGIHLILATQKPSGVVDEQIWTNSKFKLCLKVQNEQDSREMLKTPDAANITQAGRAYLQVGNNEIYELFQSAWSGASYDESEESGEAKVDDRVYQVNQLGQGKLINQDLGGSVEDNKIKATQLDAVVEHINQIFGGMKLPKVKSPWLPPLTDKMISPHFSDIRDTKAFTEMDLTVKLGVVDIPHEQKQEEYELDFLHEGHAVYFASSGYGKSVFLTTLLLSLCAKNSVANMKAYILDFGSSALIAMRDLPHVADYITFDDTEKIQKLQVLIKAEIKTRKQLLAREMVQNFELYNQSSSSPIPALFLILDNYDIVKELGGEEENFFSQIARDGSALGIYLVMTAGRSSVVKYALLSNIKTKIAGFNFEPTEARNIVGRSEYTIPEIRGRSMVKQDVVNLMQIYLPVDFADNMDYNRKLKELIRQIKDLSSENKAKGIPVLPEQFSYKMIGNYEKAQLSDIILGLEKKDITLIGLKVTESPFLILGPVRCGKTNAAHLVLNQLAGFERIYLFDSREEDCSSYKKQSNVEYIDSKSKAEEALEELKELLEERSEEYQDMLEDGEDMSAREFYGSLPRICLFINGIDEFAQLAKDVKNQEALLNEAKEKGILIVMVGHSARMPVREDAGRFAKTAEYGLVLGEQSIFPVKAARDLPQVIEDGLFFNKGTAIMLRIPKV